ncbi:family 16 glycosylhydrolase [Polaribacter sp. Asnod1-A03]|uniref:glycoside hydrolase family 16 protein n=1 Tax=Polaribacter sp. Asnod1-A03 TaxID=3160581 RepID=UPI0038695208
MKKMKNIYIVLFSVMTAFFGCQEKEYEFGDIIAPSNIVVSTDIMGVDDNNPYGDGTGFVDFKVTAENAISYKFNYGDGTEIESVPSGVVTKRFSLTDINTYTVIVTAIGTGGSTSTTSVDLTVYSAFEDLEAVKFLAGSEIGDRKTWYWQANESGFISMGPVTDDYGNGEFAYGAWWPGPDAWAEDRSCFSENNEFVFTTTQDGMTFEQTAGPAFIPGTYAGYIGIDGDQCYDETVVTTMYGVKNVTFAPSSSKAALEGSFDDEPYRQTTFEISDGGFMGWYVGTSTYDIISLTDDEMIVRVIEDPATGTGAAWYHRFTSTKPVEGVVSVDYEYNNLVWEDDFNTDGAPDVANWTYDLGAGGWGNGESQTYTDATENAKVENGSLIITAKADGNGGYTSARLKSQGLYKFTYGRVEVRAKLPASQGTWPAIWMLGSNFPTVGWPTCGEIDIMEQTGADKNTSLGTLHWLDAASSSNASYGETTSVANASSEFHLYTLEWTDAAIKIYLDDVQFYEMTNSSDLPFNTDFFLILNVAMGGTLGGEIPDIFTEDTMEIDYVKVYQ